MAEPVDEPLISSLGDTATETRDREPSEADGRVLQEHEPDGGPAGVSGQPMELKQLGYGYISSEEKKSKAQTVFFNDEIRRIDFMLTYESNDQKKEVRQWFLESGKKNGLEFEEQDCSESPDHKTYFIKVHGTHTALLKGAEDLLLRMPVEKNNLSKDSWWQWCFCKNDPFNPKIPEELEVEKYFSVPFNYKYREKFIGWDNEEEFFTSAQRSVIVWHILQNTRFGEENDDIGCQRLVANKTFTSAYPLHESSQRVCDGEKIKTDRQLLHYEWASWKKWYKRQPLDQIRRYFGERIGIYFTWLGFYTTWLLPVAIIGILVMLYGLSTIPLFRNPPATDICEEMNRTDYYMCPLCDTRCDFWYLTDTCGFAHVSLVFDNEATVLFAIIMAFWAVLFLEFWKRRQYQLQFEWNLLGYESAEERARPEFEHRIKGYIDRASSLEKMKKFYIYNPVLDRDEYIQPAYWFLPKIIVGFSLLFTLVFVVLAIVFGVLLYRLAIAGAIYVLVSDVDGGPSVGDLAVSMTAAIIQLITILILNKIYSYLAKWLTEWELQRTRSDYDYSFTSKMYLFQFVNFYTSLFYIAFFKGNFSGYPGGYQRIGGLRLDECSSYGCLLELTIQLAIIMVGKQILNNCQELALPYVKRIINWCKHKEEAEEDIYTRWEKDFDLNANEEQGLFYEYLELVIQYGFVTIFVAAFPLAPFFALLNNWVEIRLDAHKFVTLFRRPVAERAQDIGAWYSILNVVSKLAVVTNAFLIAFASQTIPFQVYYHGEYGDDYRDLLSGSAYENDTELTYLSGYVNWSLSEFPVEVLLDGNAFPAFTAHELPLYDDNGDELMGADNSPLLYLPWIDFDCLMEQNIDSTEVTARNITLKGEVVEMTTFTLEQYDAFFKNSSKRALIFDVKRTSDSPSEREAQICFSGNETYCKFRGLVAVDGSHPLEFWQTLSTRVIFAVLFEHLVFVVAGFLAWLVPDVPQSVKNEIKREKLLAHQAIHVRKDDEKSTIQDFGNFSTL